MEHRNLAMSIVFVLAALSSTLAKESAKLIGRSDVSSDAIDHQPQKRSALMSPPVDEGDVMLDPEDFDSDAPYAFLEEPSKRGSTLFRFGKRGTLFRFGKRGGSLFRFGKRGTPFRFGKRGGSLFRFGRSGPVVEYPADDSAEEVKRTLFRFGKRSELDNLRSIMAQFRQVYPSYIEDVDSKRDGDGFHWGKDGDK